MTIIACCKHLVKTCIFRRHVITSVIKHVKQCMPDGSVLSRLNHDWVDAGANARRIGFSDEYPLWS